MAVNGTTNSTSKSSTEYSYLQYKNKIGGLVSGMDIDSIMEKLMKAESAQMEKLQQQKQKYEWQRDAYRDVNLKLDTFQKGIFDDYGLKSDWNAKNVSVSSSSVSATALTAASGTLNISQATMATAARKVVDVTATTTAGSTIKDTTTMAELGYASGGSITLKAINDKGEFQTNGVKISYNATDKLSDVLAKITSSSVGISAIVATDSTTNKTTISLTANSTGFANDGGLSGSMEVVGDDNGLFNKLGLLSGSTGMLTTDSINNPRDVDASNGSITVNGVNIKGTSNSYTVSGYQLKVNSDITQPVTVSSTTDVDKIVDKVKTFVKSYNDLISDLNQRVTEKKKTDYQPLTDAQKAGMTTDEITKWETAAKAGLLKGDNTLNTVLSNMRQTISTYGGSTNGTGNNSDMLYKIGVSTTKTWSDGGKLEVDEDKLRQALQDDPNIVSRIFTGDSATGAKGIVSTLRTTVQTAVSTIKETAGSDASTADNTYSLGKTISTLGTKISDWKDRLKGIEERYWKQFSAMETAMQKANSQTSIFSSSSN